MEYPLEKIREVLKLAKEPISLETPIGEEEDSHLGDFIEDKKTMSPSEATIQYGYGGTNPEAPIDPDAAEEKILRLRFGISERVMILREKRLNPWR